MRGDSMSSPLKPFSLYKHNPLFVKLVVVFLSLGLAFRLLSSHSFDFNSSSVLYSFSPPTIDTQETDLLISDKGTFTVPQTEVSKEEAKQKCDLFNGDGVPNPSGAVYNNNSCMFIEDYQNYMRNGTPDSGYLYWRWSPRDCELPKFNPERFLGLMRNKRWAFIGDSISRNHVQSFICILVQVEPAKEIYHDEQFKSKT